ncbi:lipopolysaccharide biosynthesis protein [Selenomonas ruminantium]|uniref:Membrane protein involved in the export of O-antigen and teichoic acid n=1 Tax=Selenomonas ruminantium TaxID=971 RepID=A0A1H0NYD3_SELRU|nr:MATE family efflux transporter [Selenomonas ruminantium]SDO97663.1 Membrane protein involved in the export of O-antigen and teichoic acid [Selenomonas ruminantium]
MIDSRSRNVKKNIAWSFVLKAVSVGLSFLVLPLTVNYLTAVEYGVWVTLFSVMNWVNMLDMGIGLGFRNRLAEAVAKQDISLVRCYMSAGIFSLSGIGLLLLILFLIGINFVDFQAVFNSREISEADLYTATLYTGIFVIATFVLSVINQIYYAYQQAAKTGFINIVHNMLMLICIYYLTLQAEHKLVYFVFCFGIASLSSRVLFLGDFFARNRNVWPCLSLVKISYIKNITGIGVQFFVIQLAVICLFSSSNILITQRLGPEHVLAYDIVFKIFSIVTMIHGIICAPLWNAYTEAYVKKDFIWLRQTIKRMIKLMVPIGAMCVALILLNEWLIAVWIRKNVEIPSCLALSAGLFAFISCLNNVFAIFLNGVNRIRLQMYLSIISAMVVIPLAWWLMGVMDVTGMMLAIVICMSVGTLPLGMQVRNILRG